MKLLILFGFSIVSVGDQCLSKVLLLFNMAHAFRCAMSVRRGVRGLKSIFRDQIKGSDEFSDFKSGCDGSHHLW